MITLETAQTMARVALETGRARGMAPLSVVVLDAGGHPIFFARGDGASPGRFEIARAKAFGAVMLGIGGYAQRTRAEAQAYFMNTVNGIFGGRVLPVPGGVLVRDGAGAVVGAVGVTGDTSENDAEAAMEGIAAAGFAGEA